LTDLGARWNILVDDALNRVDRHIWDRGCEQPTVALEHAEYDRLVLRFVGLAATAN
jgi:hypothetical protein